MFEDEFDRNPWLQPWVQGLELLVKPTDKGIVNRPSYRLCSRLLSPRHRPGEVDDT